MDPSDDSAAARKLQETFTAVPGYEEEEVGCLGGHCEALQWEGVQHNVGNR